MDGHQRELQSVVVLGEVAGPANETLKHHAIGVGDAGGLSLLDDKQQSTYTWWRSGWQEGL